MKGLLLLLFLFLAAGGCNGGNDKTVDKETLVSRAG